MTFALYDKKSGSNVRCRSPVDSPVYVRLSSAQKFKDQVAHYVCIELSKTLNSRGSFEGFVKFTYSNIQCPNCVSFYCVVASEA